ncbi:uncharacterized protein LOC142007046 [Carettochelys insculpta]|uniref:uncharacterized protein LOC142007046 n=1 Tax=Carettochelys insculpta TaxID=44489 RepID=UPI003EBB0B24
MAARQPPKRPQGTLPKGSPGSQPSSQAGKQQRGPSWMEAKLWDLLGLWSEEEVLQVMGSKRRNADAFAQLAEGLAARGHPACTPDHVRSKVKELQQGYARARDAAGRSGAAPVTHPFYRELRAILGPRHTSSPPATLDTSADEPQQAPEAESAPEASPAPRGPPRSPPPGHRRRRRRRGSPPPATPGSGSSCHPGAPAGRPPPGCPPTVGVDCQLHHQKDRRAPARCQWSRTALRGHHSRPAPRRRTDQPHGGEDGGPSTTSRRQRTPSCWPSTVGSWRSPSSGCGWRNTASTSRSGRWPGARRHGEATCGPSTVSRTTWPPMLRWPLLRPPCLLHLLLHPLLQPLRRLPSHRHPPPRGTWAQLTLASRISRSARPPARAEAEAGIPAAHSQCWTLGVWGPGRGPLLPLCIYSPQF